MKKLGSISLAITMLASNAFASTVTITTAPRVVATTQSVNASQGYVVRTPHSGVAPKTTHFGR